MPYKDVEARRAYGREWMRRNAEKAREAMRRWRSRHPELKRQSAQGYYRLHRHEILVAAAAYERAHPDIRRSKHARRRAREIGALGTFTEREWLDLVERYEGRCAYRGESGPLHADHRIPISRGGANSIENILPACRRCNQEKYTMTEDEFRERLRREGGGGPFEVTES